MSADPTVTFADRRRHRGVGFALKTALGALGRLVVFVVLPCPLA